MMSEKIFNEYIERMKYGDFPVTSGWSITKEQFDAFIETIIIAQFFYQKTNWYNVVRYMIGWTLKVDPFQFEKHNLK